MDTNFRVRTTYDEFQRSTTIIRLETFDCRSSDLTCTQKTLPAIYHIRNTPTEPSRLWVTPSQPLLATRVLVSSGPINLFRRAVDIPVIFYDSLTWEILCTDYYFWPCVPAVVAVSNNLWLVRMSVVTDHTRGWKVNVVLGVRWVLWFLRMWNIFAYMFVFTVVGFSTWKSLYLPECEKSYGRHIRI
jgi:hypothetical protein